MGWFEEISNGIYEALCAAFEVDPDGEGLKRFVPAYVEDTLTPQAPRNVNVCYYYVGTYQGDSGFDYIMHKQSTRNGKVVTEIKKTIPASVLVTFYGPDADNDAEAFWSLFQWDNGVKSPRSILRRKNIVPIGKPARPVSLYEDEGTYKRKRSDVRVNLAYYEVTVKDSSHIDVIPELEFLHIQP